MTPAFATGAGASTVRSVALPGEPRVGVMDGADLWVLVDETDGRHLVEVPAASRRAVTDVPVGGPDPVDLDVLIPSVPRPSLARTPGSLWTVDAATSTLVRVSTADGSIEHLPLKVKYVASGPAGLWVLLPREPAEGGGVVHPVARLDPATGAVVLRHTLGPGLKSAGPVELAVGVGTLFMSFVSPDRHPFDIDAATGQRDESRVGGSWQLFARGATLLATRRYPRSEDRGVCSVSVTVEGAPTRELPMTRRTRGRACTSFVRDAALGPAGRAWAVFAGRPGRPGSLSEARLGSRRSLRITQVGGDPVDLVPDRTAVWVLDRAARRAVLMSSTTSR